MPPSFLTTLTQTRTISESPHQRTQELFIPLKKKTKLQKHFLSLSFCSSHIASSLQSFEASVLTSTFNFDANFHCICSKYNHNHYHKQTGPSLRSLAALTTRHYRDAFTKLKPESVQNDRMKREEERQPSELLQVVL